ncbi:hypothetical protein CGMCC3_g7133 [Colletotrichum fructicola]|uniref:DUF6546 domain-containing protein n=2 Tax=Colletotrichum fructicola (strain Nara gc5) TaxID=1213859 RepID=A0A7J6JKP6_COLFN|nr:uncharacterized protein CGMCC3_g7133 [Colletotrichum fructicola]KAE9576854.1 hypothetical protein CGMCC3_g7133 [Colletotrichum fructicola]KAF4413224.1 hypothetical protein CFRS1_v004194 [Colletotrichum fructicola]KAF4491316.1 hypothetical protein CGGC5_v001447 [Colletotrichum fructicola Nara gc5]KAF5514297.1 hypothetical protein CGCF413_v001405 [Colletotrichum fructicola]
MMDRFYQLPPELRATVVESLVDHWRYADEQESIAPYASVCKEWQALVERYNFSALRVTQESLNEFEAYMVGSRRGLLKQINLHVQLPNYDNDPCEKKETWEDKFENNMCFTKAVHGLFRLMSSWTFSEACREGVDLTLSISSPSDLRNANFELWQRRRWNIKDIGEKRFADSWIDFVGHDEEFARNNPLPRVDVIRSFLASPQNHRALMPAAHADIVARLPCLREASFDILKDRRKETRKIHFNQFAGSMAAWPLSLEKLTISSNTISSWRHIPHETLAEADSGAKLCDKLRRAAHFLKHLNITNVVRIREFLKPHWPSGVDDTEPFVPKLCEPVHWRLETLNISYGSIWYNTEWHKQGDDINESSDLVEFRQCVSLAAARLAYTMPKLKHMIIKQRPLMYAGKHELEYRVNGDKASLVWTSSFDFRPWERTMEAWTEVARRHAGARLEVRTVTTPWHTDGKAPHLPSLTF